jgi:hypothetical protein
VPVRPCIVAFTDARAFVIRSKSRRKHSTKRSSSQREGSVSTTQLEVEVQAPSVKHRVTILKVREWLDDGAKSPKERLVKERLKGLLAP